MMLHGPFSFFFLVGFLFMKAYMIVRFHKLAWEFENFIFINFLKRWVICNDPDRQWFFYCCCL